MFHGFPQTGELTNVYGPMRKERFARQELVGDTPYPPEFYAVPFYLKRLGYSYDEAKKVWVS